MMILPLSCREIFQIIAVLVWSMHRHGHRIGCFSFQAKLRCTSRILGPWGWFPLQHMLIHPKVVEIWMAEIMHNNGASEKAKILILLQASSYWGIFGFCGFPLLWLVTQPFWLGPGISCQAWPIPARIFWDWNIFAHFQWPLCSQFSII